MEYLNFHHDHDQVQKAWTKSLKTSPTPLLGFLMGPMRTPIKLSMQLERLVQRFFVICMEARRDVKQTFKTKP